jgi:hypothetical protein
VLDVRVDEVSDLFGASFTLEFPDDLLAWRKNGVSEGSFLSGGGEFDTELLVENRPAGTLVIGHSRLGSVAGAEGSGTLFSLEFSPQFTGSGALALGNRDLLDAFGEVQADVTWIGGSVDVRAN